MCGVRFSQAGKLNDGGRNSTESILLVLSSPPTDAPTKVGAFWVTFALRKSIGKIKFGSVGCVLIEKIEV